VITVSYPSLLVVYLKVVCSPSLRILNIDWLTKDRREVIGSCNGLISLWNLTTRTVFDKLGYFRDDMYQLTFWKLCLVMIIHVTLIRLWHYRVIVTRQKRCKFLFSAIIFKEIFKVSLVGLLSRYFPIPIPGSMVVYIRIAPLIGWPLLVLVIVILLLRLFHLI
jgi:hypothetical protein